MTTKLEQAARALLAHWDTPAWKYLKPTGDLMADLREALDHSGEADEMVGCAYCNNPLFAGTKCNNCGRVVAQPVSQQYQDHLVNQSFDWSAMAAKHQFMEGYRIGLAEMREKCAKVCDERVSISRDVLAKSTAGLCAAAIRAIKFEGDTGFRPVSEMIAEHKQDPKKGAAIEKAKMRKVARAVIEKFKEKNK